MSKNIIRKIAETLEEGEGFQLPPDMKVECFQCGKQIKYDENDPTRELGVPASYQDQETGEVYDEIICLRCAAQVNKETNGEFLGVDSIEDLDLPIHEEAHVRSKN